MSNSRRHRPELLLVAIFLSCGSGSEDYVFLEKEAFETEYGVTGMVKERKAAWKEHYVRLNIAGTVLCILGVAPLFAHAIIEGSDLTGIAALCVTILSEGIGCMAFIYGGVYQAAVDKLLEEGDYTRKNKARQSVMGGISLLYWLVVTAVFLFYTFGSWWNGQPQHSWLIWAIGGLYGGVLALIGMIGSRKD